MRSDHIAPARWVGRCLFVCCLGMSLGLWHSDAAEARRRRIKASIAPGKQNTSLQVKVRRGAFQRAMGASRAIRASLWVRRPAGWVRVYKRVLLQHRWTHALSTKRLCRRSLGRTQVALQVAMRYGEYWWNRWQRRWQRKYISLHQATAWIACPAPNDLPPGAPPVAQVPAAPPLLPGFPPGRKPPKRAPQQGPPPHGVPEDRRPTPPPPPPVVSRRSFRSFRRSLKAARFSNSKRSTLRSWLRGLGDRKLRPYMVAKTIKAFSFSSDKLKAARALARHVLRPLRAVEVNRIIKHVSGSSTKVKVALLFCRGLVDSANAHLIAKQFTFSSSKRKILRGCR